MSGRLSRRHIAASRKISMCRPRSRQFGAACPGTPGAPFSPRAPLGPGSPWRPSRPGARFPDFERARGLETRLRERSLERGDLVAQPGELRAQEITFRKDAFDRNGDGGFKNIAHCSGALSIRPENVERLGDQFVHREPTVDPVLAAGSGREARSAAGRPMIRARRVARASKQSGRRTHCRPP